MNATLSLVGGAQSSGPTNFSLVREERAAQILSALATPGSAVLLIGEAGSGKSYLAEFVTRELSSTVAGHIEAFTFAHPPLDPANHIELGDLVGSDLRRGIDFGALTPAEIAEQLEQAAFSGGDNVEPLFLLRAVDRYPPAAVAVLEHLLRNRRVRIIATTTRMLAGASQMARDPGLTRVTVGALDLEEAGALIASVLGHARLSQGTLERWHTTTGGNSHALIMMLIANERAGVLRRRRGIAYVSAADEVMPEEFASYLDDTCTAAERATLEVIALAHPFSGAGLFHLIDPGAIASLVDRDLVRPDSTIGGESGLRITSPMLATTVISRIDPARREALLREFFDALTGGRLNDEFAATSPNLLRAVDFGLRLDLSLPESWLVAAIEKLTTNGDPHLMLRVSLVLARSCRSADAVAAAIRAISYAQQLDRPADVDAAYRYLDQLLEHTDEISGLTPELELRMKLTRVERLFLIPWPMPAVLDKLAEIEASLDPAREITTEIFQAFKTRLLIRNADFTSIDVDQLRREASSDFVIETVRSPARSLYGVVLM